MALTPQIERDCLTLDSNQFTGDLFDLSIQDSPKLQKVHLREASENQSERWMVSTLHQKEMTEDQANTVDALEEHFKNRGTFKEFLDQQFDQKKDHSGENSQLFLPKKMARREGANGVVVKRAYLYQDYAYIAYVLGAFFHGDQSSLCPQIYALVVDEESRLNVLMEQLKSPVPDEKRGIILDVVEFTGSHLLPNKTPQKAPIENAEKIDGFTRVAKAYGLKDVFGALAPNNSLLRQNGDVVIVDPDYDTSSFEMGFY